MFEIIFFSSSLRLMKAKDDNDKFKYNMNLVMLAQFYNVHLNHSFIHINLLHVDLCASLHHYSVCYNSIYIFDEEFLMGNEWKADVLFFIKVPLL